MESKDIFQYYVLKIAFCVQCISVLSFSTASDILSMESICITFRTELNVAGFSGRFTREFGIACGFRLLKLM